MDGSVLKPNPPGNLFPCSTVAWRTSAFSECSRACGGGKATRSVECERSSVVDGAVVEVVGDAECDQVLGNSSSSSKPEPFVACNTHKCAVEFCDGNSCFSNGVCEHGACDCFPGYEVRGVIVVWCRVVVVVVHNS